jgi:anti-sigma regulatory factor (Ser/Thr protein kinase)
MERSARLRLAGEPASVAEAREAVTKVAEGRIGKDALETAQLLVSELVTNGIVHGGGGKPVEITISMDGRTVRVDVADGGPGFVAGDPLSENELGGWGLVLVDRLSDRWGLVRNGDTHVWFEVAAAR